MAYGDHQSGCHMTFIIQCHDVLDKLVAKILLHVMIIMSSSHMGPCISPPNDGEMMSMI